MLKNIDCIANEEVMQEQEKAAKNRLASKQLQQNIWALHKCNIRSSLSDCFLDQQVKYVSPYLKSQEIKACNTDSDFLGHHV